MVPAVLVGHYSVTYRLYITQAPAILLASTASQHRLQNTPGVRTATYVAMMWLQRLSSLTWNGSKQIFFLPNPNLIKSGP